MFTRSTPWLLLLLLSFLAVGCEKAEEDKACPAHCTVLQGQLTTDGGTRPLANVPLEVVHYQPPGFSFFGGSERSKKQGKTDAQGRYEIRVFLDDSELNAGYLKIRYAVDPTTFFLLNPADPAIYPDFQGPLRRDATVITDELVPRKAWIQPRVVASPGPGDYFNSYFTFPAPFRTRSQHVNLLSAAAGSALEVPGDLPVVVITTKVRGGVQTQVQDTLRVPGGQTLSYEPRF